MLVNGVEIQETIITADNRVWNVVHTESESDWKGNMTITVTYKDFMTGNQITRTVYKRIVED